MKKILTLFAITLAMFSMSMTVLDVQFRKPPLANTGAPGEDHCTGCHSGTPLNGGGGSMSLVYSNAKNKYVPGKSYQFTVTVMDTSESARGGFEATSLDTSNNPAGTPVVINPQNTVVSKDFDNGRTYVENFSGTPFEQWTYQWDAPTTNVGKIIVYCTTNASNDDNTDAGDHIYSAKLTIKPKRNTLDKVSDESDNGFAVYPTLIQQQFNLDYTVAEAGNVQVILYNLQGEQQQVLYSSNQAAGGYHQVISFNRHFAPGMYLVVLQEGSEKQVQKVIIQ